MPIGMMESPKVLQKIQCTKIKKSKDPEFVLKVVCNDCPAHEITRKHQDLCDFITELITCYPKLAKDLPEMKSCDWFNRGFFKNKNCKIEIDNFCQKLLDLPEDVRNDEMMVTFFSSLSAFRIACSKKKRKIAEQNGIGEPSYDCLALIPSENETRNDVNINGNIYGEGLQKTFDVPPVDKVVKTPATSQQNQSDSEVYESSTTYALYCDIDLNKEVKCKDFMRSCKVIKSHTATDFNEISVQVGQLVEILDNLPTGLVKIRWSGRVGFVPNVCLDLKEKNSVMKFGMASSDQSKVKPVANVPPLSGPHTKTEDNIEQEHEYYNSNVQEYAPQTYKITMDFTSQLKVGHIIQSSMKDTVKNLVLCMAVCRDPRQSPPLKFQSINPLWVPLRHMVLFETINTSSPASAPSPKQGTNKFTSLQSQISNKSGDVNNSKAKNEHEKVESKLSNEKNKDVEKLKIDDGKEIVYYSFVSKPNRQQPPDAVSVKSDCYAATFTDNSDKTNKTITGEDKIVSDNHKPEAIIAMKPTISEKPVAKILTNQSSIEKPTPAQKPSFNVLSNSLAVDQKNCNSDLNNHNAKKETLITDIKFTIADGVNCCGQHKIYDIDRAFAQELLKNAETGCFLFRKSVKKPGGLTLSVASSSPRQLHNFFIEIEDSKYKIGNYGFDSLDQIISYYSKNSIVENESDSALKLTKQFSIC